MNKQNVYIVPSKNGFRFITVNFFLFIFAITYANNLALLITFFMVTYFILQMFMTHKIIFERELLNLSVGNQYEGLKNKIPATFKPTQSEKNLTNIQLSLLDDQKKWIESSTKEQNSEKDLLFEIPSLKRRKVTINRVRLSTRGSNDLFYVWRYFKVSESFYIYPKKYYAPHSDSFSETKVPQSFQEKEFEYHVRYVSGMPAKRIDWKKYASSGQLYSKSYMDNHGLIREINFSNLPGEKEEKLQKMSYLIEKSFHDSIPYSLVLPTKKLPVSGGQEHFLRSMELISEY